MFASRVKAATMQAYGLEYSPSQLDEKALEVYQRALTGELGRRTREFFPQSLDHAVELSRNLSTIGVDDTDLAVVAAVAHRSVKEKEYKDKQTYKPKKEIVCWHCNKKNHTKAECWTLNPSLAPKKGKYNKKQGGDKGPKKEDGRPSENQQ